MAITARELEQELDSQDTGHLYKVEKHIPEATATTDHWRVTAVAGPNRGKSCWAESTTADSAANQAAAVLSYMVSAGPIGI